MGAVVNALVFSKVVSVPFLFLYQYVQDTPAAAIMTEITDEQLEELKEAFVLYDKVGDDKIDSADVIKLLQALTHQPTHRRREESFGGLAIGQDPCRLPHLRLHLRAVPEATHHRQPRRSDGDVQVLRSGRQQDGVRR